MDHATLNDGNRMPVLGYGLWQTPAHQACGLVADALEIGYRSFDTAQVYGNEGAVGDALAASGVERAEVFLTTKTWTDGYDRTLRSLDDSLAQLRTDYVDLVLIHEPTSDSHGTYRALEEAQRRGTVRSIGVSNFTPEAFARLADAADVVPAVNQIETHVFWQQRRAHEVLARYGTQHESWAPFAEGLAGVFHNPTLARVGDRHGKSIAQTILRFLLQSDVLVIPKSTNRQRMAENHDVFDFVLDADDMAEVAALDTGRTLIGWP
jgi:2,5-diketo-D-gluconate reductase A